MQRVLWICGLWVLSLNAFATTRIGSAAVTERTECYRVYGLRKATRKDRELAERRITHVYRRAKSKSSQLYDVSVRAEEGFVDTLKQARKEKKFVCEVSSGNFYLSETDQTTQAEGESDSPGVQCGPKQLIDGEWVGGCPDEEPSQYPRVIRNEEGQRIFEVEVTQDSCNTYDWKLTVPESCKEGRATREACSAARVELRSVTGKEFCELPGFLHKIIQFNLEEHLLDVNATALIFKDQSIPIPQE